MLAHLSGVDATSGKYWICHMLLMFGNRYGCSNLVHVFICHFGLKIQFISGVTPAVLQNFEQKI